MNTSNENAGKGKKEINFDFNNLDLKNLDKILKDVNPTIKGENFLYKFERTNVSKDEKKKLRNKLRNTRDKLLIKVLQSYKAKNNESLKVAINDFNSFYLKEYCLNDYTINSICRDKTNEESKSLINLFLNLASQLKLNVSTFDLKKKVTIKKKVAPKKETLEIKE